jgi:hypothetical protein
MDHLPAGISGAYKESLTGRRKRSSNLRDQVAEPKMWPTPVADDTGLRKKKYSQGGTPLSLAVQMQEPKMWATPTAAIAQGSSAGNPNRKNAGRDLRQDVKMYPTPAARDYKGMSGKGRQERKGNPKDTLPNAVGGSLNPAWVEWLMGYPVGYTDLDS